jgi:hypothetical protein
MRDRHRRRQASRAEVLDRTLEAQLMTELEFRRAERRAARVRTRAQREARRRFVLVVCVLVALVCLFSFLVFEGLAALFPGLA